MSDPKSFAKLYGGMAQRVGERLNVDPAIVLGQWGLETGWGKSVIPGTNNLGNIKDFSGGGVAAVDNMTGSNDKYRAFETPDAFADHYAGLIERKYPGAIGAGSDPLKFAQALQAGGYAEDPAYVRKMVNVTKSLRGTPGVMDIVASAVLPAANAATPSLSNRTAALPTMPDLSAMSDDDLINAIRPGTTSKNVANMSDKQLLSGLEIKSPDSVGRQVGLTARAAINGVTALPNMFWNGFGGAINWAADKEVVPKADAEAVSDWLGLPAPRTETERVSQDVAAALAGTGAVTKASQKLSEFAGPAVKYVAGLFADKPVQQMAGAGLSSAASSYAGERGAGPGVQIAAGLAGGMAPSMALAASRQAAKPFAPIVSQDAAQGLAGNRLAKMAQTEPEVLSLRLHQLDDELVPGSMPTTAQALDDTALLVAERGRRSGRPEFNVAFDERATAQNAARSDALERISPTNGTLQDIGTDTGALIRRAYDENYSGMKRQVNQAYAPLTADPTPNMVLPKDAVRQAVTKYFGEGSGGPDAELAAIVRELDNLPDNVPFSTLQNLKSWAGDIQAKAREAMDSRKAAAAGEVHSLFDDVPSQMVAGRNLNPSTAAQFELAKSLRRQQADRFETGPAQKMRRDGSDRAPQLQDREIPKAFFNNSPTSASDIRQFVKAVGDKDQAVEALKNYAIAGLRQASTGGGDQPFKALAFRKWLDSHSPALRMVFSDDHVKQLNIIADDLARAARSNTAARAPGSDTMMNLSSQAGWELLLEKFPMGTRVIVGAARALSGDRVGALVDRAMLEPEFAQVLLAAATKQNRARLANMLANAYAGATVGTATSVEQ